MFILYIKCSVTLEKVKYTTLFILPFCGKQRNRMELTGKMLLFAFGRENAEVSSKRSTYSQPINQVVFSIPLILYL